MPDPTYEQVQSDTLTELLEIRDSVTAGRHPKWQRVEPGTVIPAGQPYRVERPMDCVMKASEYVSSLDFKSVPTDEFDYFIDSSWKPPLVLPTEPTWGILVFKDYDHTGDTIVVEHVLDEWSRRGPGSIGGAGTATLCEVQNVLDFIPLTDEQVARIEAAR